MGVSKFRTLVPALVVVLSLGKAWADEPAAVSPESTAVAADTAIRQFKYPAGFKMNLFASDPQLANPVALNIDEQGRVYVAETFRLRTSTYDIRHHKNMAE